MQLETGGRPFSAEEETAVQALLPAAAMGRQRRPRHSRATAEAREILDAFGTAPPIDVEALAERLGYPVRWRSLPRGYRGGVEGDADHRILVLNSDYPFRSDVERRWVVAEELGHVLLQHGALVASESPGRDPALVEPGRGASEVEAKTFAAELLMPAAQVRQAFAREQAIILRALGSEERAQAIRTVIADLAREFRVSHQAMRIRLGQLGLLT